jgi:aminotransferase
LPATRLSGLRESWIREMTRIALDCGAINLAQGFPDFDPPLEVREAAARAVREGPNQYSITWGLPALREAIAASLRQQHAPHFDWVDPRRHVTVTCGVTEGIVASLMGVVDPGDEVIVVEPAHENYAPAVRFAGGTPIFLPLLAPDYRLDAERLRSLATPRTKAVLLNTPHNPTGRVLTLEELTAVAELCKERDLVAITDEIYDRILYDGRRHIALATLPGMAERAITVSGLSKTFSITGWRLGYVVAAEPWSTAARTVHDFTTICAPVPLQHAGIAAYALPESFYSRQLEEYHARRELTMRILEEAGFEARPPEGSYYVLAGHGAWEFDGDSTAFALWLAREVGVAVVGGTHFYNTPGVGEGQVRFAFAKKLETLEQVRERLVGAFERRAHR